jgi:tetratricopeptide (TPR) repeat protein
MLGQFALLRMCKIKEDAPERYRAENPESIKAHILAALVESEVFFHHAIAFENIKKTESFIVDNSQKKDFCKAVYQIAQCLDNEALNETKQLCDRLLGDEHCFTLLIHADILIREKKYELANECLGKAKDKNDPNWLQIYASYLYHTGDRSGALKYMNLACSISPHPELRKSTAHLAFETEDYDLTIGLLSQELKNDPKNSSLLSNIAAAWFRKGDFGKAADYYEKLNYLKPDETLYALNLATCYIQTGKHEKAIIVYDKICKNNNAPLEAFLSRAFLLKIGDPIKALDSILPLRDEYWDNLQYLQAILDLSYKAGKEEYGHQALLKLRELQNEGKAPTEILQKKTIEDLKVHAKQWNDRIRIIGENLLKGKFPWLMADHWQNHAAYMGWFIRTQQIDWHIEEPMTCAAFSIYSTNGFRATKQADDMTVLSLIECPPKNENIVIDLSSLITLYRLGLLNKCFEYFNKVYMPKEYPVLLLKDSESLVIHQLTRKNSAEAIKMEIDAGHIAILDDIGLPGKRPLPFVHEHTLPEKEEEHYYRLIDIINVTHDSGKLNEAAYTKLKQIAHKSSGIDTNHPPLKYGESIFVDLHTLYSICQIETSSLAPILETFKVFISGQDNLRNSNLITQINNQENIKSENEELFNICRDEDRLIKRSHTKNISLEDDDEFLASWELTKDLSIPLLADDRVLQNLAINENKDIEHAAFGIDGLLLMLHKESLISIDVLTDAFLKLISWRYRFLVPTKEILLILAKRYKSHPPGKELQKIALYVHDCMRDPGLFGGAENNTTHKESMAARLYVCWTRITAEFLVDIWRDLEFTEEAAKLLTEWAINELTPSLPGVLGVNSLRFAAHSSGAFFDYFLAFAFLIDDTSRASNALQIIAECLNMDEEEYFKAVARVVDRYGI